MELAKMIGMTPPEFTFSGKWLEDPPIIRRPTIRLALWIGIRRSERSTNTMNATTAIMPATIRSAARVAMRTRSIIAT